MCLQFPAKALQTLLNVDRALLVCISPVFYDIAFMCACLDVGGSGSHRNVHTRPVKKVLMLKVVLSSVIRLVCCVWHCSGVCLFSHQLKVLHFSNLCFSVSELTLGLRATPFKISSSSFSSGPSIKVQTALQNGFDKWSQNCGYT